MSFHSARLRPQLKFDVVIVARFDRFARSVSHLLRALEESSHLGTVVSLSESIDTSTPVGKMIFTVLGAVAELERRASIVHANKANGWADPSAFSIGTKRACCYRRCLCARLPRQLGVSRGVIERALSS